MTPFQKITLHSPIVDKLHALIWEYTNVSVCVAKDDFFCSELESSPRTISRALALLEKEGLILRETSPARQVEWGLEKKRKIYLVSKLTPEEGATLLAMRCLLARSLDTLLAKCKCTPTQFEEWLQYGKEHSMLTEEEIRGKRVVLLFEGYQVDPKQATLIELRHARQGISQLSGAALVLEKIRFVSEEQGQMGVWVGVNALAKECKISEKSAYTYLRELIDSKKVFANRIGKKVVFSTIERDFDFLKMFEAEKKTKAKKVTLALLEWAIIQKAANKWRCSLMTSELQCNPEVLKEYNQLLKDQKITVEEIEDALAATLSRKKMNKIEKLNKDVHDLMYELYIEGIRCFPGGEAYDGQNLPTAMLVEILDNRIQHCKDIGYNTHENMIWEGKPTSVELTALQILKNNYVKGADWEKILQSYKDRQAKLGPAKVEALNELRDAEVAKVYAKRQFIIDNRIRLDTLLAQEEYDGNDWDVAEPDLDLDGAQ